MGPKILLIKDPKLNHMSLAWLGLIELVPKGRMPARVSGFRVLGFRHSVEGQFRYLWDPSYVGLLIKYKILCSSLWRYAFADVDI